MSRSPADHHLLFGMLALQNNFITRDQLLAAFNAWVVDKRQPLGQILRQQNALDADVHALLDALAQRHLAHHGNDPEQSLAAIGSVISVRRELSQLVDADLQASLAHVANPNSSVESADRVDDQNATASFVGASTSGGTRFRILRPHARGGLGEVFVAEDEELHREVALKQMQDRHADSLTSRARFLLEAEITGGLEHPGIVPVYGLGSYADGRPFYAMRFIRGDSLKEAIARFHRNASGAGADGHEHSRSLPSATNAKSVNRFSGSDFRKLLGRFIDVCQAIQYAHDRGVLHRDLKPGNIMLGKYGETLVVDWGLAKVVAANESTRLSKSRTDSADRAHELAETPLRPPAASASNETVAGTAVGTPAFMSPEQAAGRLDQLGPASDVYSLGATLYCLLTGRAPIEDRETAEVLRKAQRGDFPSPRQLQSDIPSALEACCLKALALQPADRYAAPLALAEDIEHWLADEPVSAWPEPWTVRLGRWSRRNKALLTGVAGAVFVGVVALGIGTVWHQQELARRATELTLTQQAVREALDDTGASRARLHKILREPGGVFQLLDDPARWESLIKDAQADLERARALAALVGAELDPKFAEQTQEFAKALDQDETDRKAALRLEKIRFDRSVIIDGQFDFATAAREYPATFLTLGLNVPDSPAQAVGDQIAAAPLRELLVAALDDWALVAKVTGKTPLLERLLEVARRAQPDPVLADRLRQPSVWADHQLLSKLASQVRVGQASPQLLRTIATLMGKTKQSENLLRALHIDRPGDFWVNIELSRRINQTSPVEAEGYARAAIARRPTSPLAYHMLGTSLDDQGRYPEAIVAMQKAVELDSKYTRGWHDLGSTLRAYGKFVEAERAFRKVNDLDPKLAQGYSSLGTSLFDQRRMSEAVAAYQKAIELDPKSINSQVNLGRALLVHGEFAEAEKSLTAVLAMMPADDSRRATTASQLKLTQTLLSLDQRLAEVREQNRVAAPSELLEMASMCQTYKRQYALAAKFYRDAFQAEPTLADALDKQHRSKAALAAAAASQGEGDAATLTAAEKSAWRKQAHAWLDADLALHAQRVRGSVARSVVLSLFELERWRSLPQLASLRDKLALAALPEDEKQAWQRLWNELQTSLEQVQARFIDTRLAGTLAPAAANRAYPRGLVQGKTYLIELDSSEFDALLRVEDALGKRLAENDDIGGGNRNSRLFFDPPASGPYRIVATSFGQRGFGAYTLRIREFKDK